MLNQKRNRSVMYFNVINRCCHSGKTMKIANGHRTISCSDEKITSNYEPNSHPHETGWKCTNAAGQPDTLKEEMLFGLGMNVTMHNYRFGNLSDNGVNLKVSYKHHMEETKTRSDRIDFRIMNFIEFDDYCVSHSIV